jgi:hypothetical protein
MKGQENITKLFLKKTAPAKHSNPFISTVFQDD